jgi:hypothetical protein
MNYWFAHSFYLVGRPKIWGSLWGEIVFMPGP